MIAAHEAVSERKVLGPDEVTWLREDHGGLLWGSSYEQAPWLACVETDPPNRFDQLPLGGVEKVRRDGESASRAIPVPASYRSMTVVGGRNAAEITHGPGSGKLLADTIAVGSSRLTDGGPFRLDRFGDRYATDAVVVASMDEVLGSIFAGSAVAG